MPDWKHLILEMHRRSLWQVLGIYLAAAWGVLQFVEFLTRVVGLPDWVTPLALVLCAVGLPVVLGTAFVQEGHPLRSRVDEDPTLLPGLESAGAGLGETSAHAAAGDPGGAATRGGWSRGLRASLAPGAVGWLTWRRALLGGVLAFAGLGATTSGYMGMRVLGIGPAGTLLAAGVLSAEDRVVLADFSATDAEEPMANVMTEALRIDLLQSRAFALVDVADLQQVLGRMEHAAGSRITEDVARSAARREGYKLVLAGDIGRLGSGYVLTARLIEAESGTTVAAFRQTAAGDGELLAAVDRLSKAIRTKIGESLRSLNTRDPLERVTTSSMEALFLYTTAERIASGREERDGRSEIDIMMQAVALDSTFAMAHRKLGAWLLNIRAVTPALESIRAAYRHRERLPEVERRLAEGLYSSYVMRDRWAAGEAHRRVLELEPNDKSALNNITADYLFTGRPELAVQAGERGIAQPFRYHSQFYNLAGVYMSLGRWADADAMADSMIAEFAMSRNGWLRRIEVAARQGDLDRADSLASHAIGFDSVMTLRRYSVQEHRASVRAIQGRAAAALEDKHDMVAHTRQIGITYPALIAAVRAARLELELRGNRSGALNLLARSLAEFPVEEMPAADAPVLSIAYVYAAAGEIDQAAQWLARADSIRPPEAKIRGEEHDVALARMMMHQGRAGEAVELLRRSARENYCVECVAIPLAEAFDQLGQADSAAVYYRTFVEVHSVPLAERAVFLAPAHFRLAELLEAQGDSAGAARHYAAFVSLRRRADPELQGQVRAAEQRLAAIRGRG
jgi:eukaryotic-like serine/threonine-protein kinase